MTNGNSKQESKVIDPGCSSSIRIHVVYELWVDLFPMEPWNVEQGGINDFLEMLPGESNLLFCLYGKFTHENVLQERGARSESHPSSCFCVGGSGADGTGGGYSRDDCS